MIEDAFIFSIKDSNLHGKDVSFEGIYSSLSDKMLIEEFNDKMKVEEM